MIHDNNVKKWFNQKDFKVYHCIQELLLKAVAGEDHDEELAKVMAVYGDTDLQQSKLEVRLSLLPDVVQAMGYDTSRFDIADLLDFFQSLGNARTLLLSEICTLGKLMLVSKRSFSALKQVKTYLRSATGGQAQPPHAPACPQEIGKWYWHGGGRQFVCGGQPAAQATVWEVFKYDLPMKSTFASKATQTV